MSSVATSGPILVTGASGFVGACVAMWFAARGGRVVAVEGPSKRGWRLQGAGGIERVPVDLDAPDDVRALVRELEPEVVIHCAGYGAYPHQTDTARIYRVNFDGVRHLLDALADVQRLRAFVQAGSSSEYGLNCTAPREDAATRPDSDYAVSKVAATAYVQYVGAKRRIPAWVFRLYSVYGPYEDASRLVPRLLSHARKGSLPALVNPRISRDFVFIDDVCAAFERIVERAPSLTPGEVFNIGTGQKTNLEQIVSLVRKQHDIAAEPAWGTMADRRWDHADWYAAPAKAEEVFGWRATTSLSDGLAKTASWMDENPALVRAADENSVTGGS